MKAKTINIPQTVADMRIKHLPFLLELRELVNKGEDLHIIEICKLNSKYTGIPYNELKEYSKDQNRKLFKHILDTFDTYEPGKVPLSLEYEGAKYVFNMDFSKMPVVWFLDVDSINFEENPADLISFCYIEEGHKYGETDEHQNLTNPRSQRNEVFEKHLPLNTFLDIQGFFLESWSVLQKWSTKAKSLAKEREQQRTPTAGGSQ